jgi:prephenate dehydratase
MRVAIQGEAGSFSHQAALALLADAQPVWCRSFADVFIALQAGQAQVAVIPVENTIAGKIPEVRGLLAASGLTVQSELKLRISHCLIGVPGATIRGIRQVYSHPVALAQCRKFLAQHKQIKAFAFDDTAGAVRHIVAEGHLDSAAIAGASAAEAYGGEILARELEDRKENFTRFLLVG